MGLMLYRKNGNPKNNKEFSMASRGNAAVNEASMMNQLEGSQQIAMVEIDKNVAKNQESAKPIAMMEKDSKAMYGKSGACTAMFLFGALVIVGLITIIVYQAKILHVLQKGVKKK